MALPHTGTQTYEGGLGGEPGNEAHGGYTYCGTAALLLLDRVNALDVPRLVHWLLFKQVCEREIALQCIGQRT